LNAYKDGESVGMETLTLDEMLIADRIWIATALLHRGHPKMESFTKDEIRKKLSEEGLDEGAKEGSINAHLKEHCVANVPPSSGKYRMLFEPVPGKLRLFRPGDLTHPARFQPRKPSKSIPRREQIPAKYRPLIDWYESWSTRSRSAAPLGSDSQVSPTQTYENDPLIRLIGSGKHIWADEHADEYVENLRREDV
jgi:hypothetical protein